MTKDHIPKHPRDMNIKPGDVIKCVDSSGDLGFTIGKDYPLTGRGEITSDYGDLYNPKSLSRDYKFIVVNRAAHKDADEGWSVEWYLNSEFEFRIRGNTIESRPITPISRRVEVFGTVIVRSGIPDWATFEKNNEQERST